MLPTLFSWRGFFLIGSHHSSHRLTRQINYCTTNVVSMHQIMCMCYELSKSPLQRHAKRQTRVCLTAPDHVLGAAVAAGSAAAACSKPAIGPLITGCAGGAATGVLVTAAPYAPNGGGPGRPTAAPGAAELLTTRPTASASIVAECECAGPTVAALTGALPTGALPTGARPTGAPS